MLSDELNYLDIAEYEALQEKCSEGEKQTISVKVTGSGGLAVSHWLSIPFIQEVVASTTAVQKIIPQTDVVIELGGEDAKITYFTGGVEQRMNGTCAGGTGSFIDQMASLLRVDTLGLNELAKKYKEEKVNLKEEKETTIFKNLVSNEWKLMWRSPTFNINLICSVLVLFYLYFHASYF